VIRDGQLTDERVLHWLQLLNTYTEISPSGRGLRVIAAGSLPPQDRKLGNYECYDSERFVTLTGNLFEVPA
jgi:putative DNA primase/helicase